MEEKFYYNHSSCMGYEQSKHRYSQFPTEQEYHEHLEEEESDNE